MTDEKEFTKIHAEVPVAREVKAIAAIEGRHVYEVIGDMLTVYKAAKIETLPAPKGGKKVRIVKVKAH